MTDALIGSAVIRAVGLALLDFVWQGAIAGTATALALVALRRATAQARYLTACAGLALMAAAPIVTVAGSLRESPLSAKHVVTPSARPAASATALTNDGQMTTTVRLGSASRLERQLPTVVLIWSGGVILLTAHLLLGWMRVVRIRRRACGIATRQLTETVRRIAARLGVSRPVQLLDSALVDVPSVMGWLRPAIVLPFSALAGLAPAHLEAILAHELAHIRRADYLINVLQSVVEILLFYHPAVWWVSRRIRLEREHCCDDVAAALCGDRAVYARALASLEELRVRMPALAMGAGGGDLLDRVRRLIDPAFTSGPRLSGGLAMSVVLTVLLLALSSQMSGTPAASQPAAAAGFVQTQTVPEPVVTTTSQPQQPTTVITTAPADKPGASRRAVTTTRTVRPAVTTTVEQGARLSGVVTDPSGGVIPGARVIVTVPSVTTPQQTTTDANGQFTIVNLPSCDCQVSVSIPGFKTSSAAIQLKENQTFDLRVRLQIGSIAEMVTVRAVTQNAEQTAATVTPMPSTLRTSADYYDAARIYYQQERLTDAEAMTARAVELLQIEVPDPAPAGAQPEVVVRVGGNIREPRKIRHVPPIYPADAQAASATGYVVIQAVIAKNGSVKDARVIQSVPLLDAAALGAVRQWLFTPTLLNNTPVEVLMTVTVRFER
ncbi:MAG: TonB family protein [Acidobacteriota bacterium]